MRQHSHLKRHFQPFKTKYNLGNCTVCKQPLKPNTDVVGVRLTSSVNTTAYVHVECVKGNV